MKTFKILTIIILSSLVLGSCLVDQTDYMDKNDQGPNLYGFLNASMNATITADGNTKDISIPISVYGPTSYDITSDITTSVVVDPSSTAIEGVHYEFATSSVTFSPSNSLFANLGLTLLSEGIDAPAELHLVLKLGESSDPNVKASGKKGSVDIAIKYLCFSDLVHDYHVISTREDGAQFDQGTESFRKTADGEYVSYTTGGWAIGTIAPDQGFSFIDFCGSITVPTQDLCQGTYSNQVYQTEDQQAASNVSESGDVHIEYTISFSAGDRAYANDYTKL